MNPAITSFGLNWVSRKSWALCHTALIQGYVIEGHVPASDIQRLLKDKPQALGLAVPGMRVGSPGMDGPAYGGRHDRYEGVAGPQGRQQQCFQHLLMRKP
jgi:hypothetical protein